MAAHGYHRGHPMTFDEATQVWRYDDTLGAVPSEPERPCGFCGLGNTPEGHDGCLGTLPGVVNACCGHGRAREAYVQFSQTERLSGPKALAWIAAAGEG